MLHVCYVEHSQPTNVGTPTKDQNRSKDDNDENLKITGYNEHFINNR